MPTMDAWYCPCKTWTPAAKSRCINCGRVRPQSSPIQEIEVDEPEPAIQIRTDDHRHRRPAANQFGYLRGMLIVYRLCGWLCFIAAALCVIVFVVNERERPFSVVTFVASCFGVLFNFGFAEAGAILLVLEERSRLRS